MLEIEFNVAALTIKEVGPASTRICSLLKNKEWERGVFEGVFSLFTDAVKKAVMEGYKAVAKVNHQIGAYATVPPEGNAGAEAVDKALNAMRSSKPYVENAFTKLKEFLA